jgi:TM2 domain-containing membrane protein YozV
MSTSSVPQKSFVVTWLLSLLLGYFGIDRFYLGKIGTGILKLITLGGFGLWYLIDLILVLGGAQTDNQNRPLAGYQQYKTIAIILSIVFVVLFGFGGIFGSHR